MKRILLTFAAVLAFGLAHAQDPQQPVAKKEIGKKEPVTTKTEVDQQNQKEMQPKPVVVNTTKPVGPDNSQTKKEELVMDDHVQATPTPQRATDATTAKKVRKASKKRQ